MKTAQNFAAPAISTVAEINARNIRWALKDYVKHTSTHGVIDDISDAFIDRLAYDSAVAKSGLREIFRNVKGWIEDLQAIVINGTTTHDTNWEVIRRLTDDITADYHEKFSAQIGKVSDVYSFNEFHNATKTFHDAMDTFQRPDGAKMKHCLEALKKIAPHAYRKNRPLHKVFKDTAIGSILTGTR